MKHLILPLATLTAFSFTTVFAAEIALRPGRWESTLDVKLPEQMLADLGIKWNEPHKTIHCVTEETSIQDVLAESPEEDCTMSNYREGRDDLQFTLKCDYMTVDYRFVRHTSDYYSGTGVSHSEDPTQRMTFTAIAKSIGDTCSAKELADAKANEE